DPAQRYRTARPGCLHGDTDRRWRRSEAAPLTAGQSIFAPDAATTSFHSARSFAAYANAPSGVLDNTRAPPTRKRFWTSSSAAIFFMAPAIFSTIGRGVPAGTTKAAQDVTIKSFTPASPMVGTSAIVGQRCAEVTARARILPELIAGT